MRAPFIVTPAKESVVIGELAARLVADGYSAADTFIITVSTDYSSVVGQHLRHALSIGGEICGGFGIDVPYPDEEWDTTTTSRIEEMFRMYRDEWSGKRLLLVEAGVIRGTNFRVVVEIARGIVAAGPILTLAMWENIGSKWQSDYVGEYYDDGRQDLTFWWERPNTHWTSKLNN